MTGIVSDSEAPRIEVLRRASRTGKRLGVFAASFNPPTIAHLELMRRAADRFSLGELLALAGVANADKSVYESTLSDRLEMMLAASSEDPRISVGVSSHAFYVDMVDALDDVYPDDTDLHFIIGFDTFERVLDPQDRYTVRYHRRFENRREALDYLFSRAKLIVANRAGSKQSDIERLLQHEPEAVRKGVLLLEFPEELTSCSATEVRKRIRGGVSISDLVPPEVESYIIDRGLYR
ncbi:MAG TPA: nicotinate-nicotinamide nucleotide adenylyltransferase [Blastocatellia bacterium]|nr:nicotinate-nicotinamide nucleotide adenylyltransferase [Blastocatellia bacterium]